MPKMYDELAVWWPLISPPEEYVEEAEFFRALMFDDPAFQPASLLELGSGGGNNALHLKSRFSSVTLVELSPQMLAVSQQLNPDCKHLVGDMRTVRLGREFDVVFIHDAIDYMLTRDDLRAALETAFVHCRPGGLALFVPDHLREMFKPDTDWGGSDGETRAARYLEWMFDPDETDTTYTVDYVFVLKEADGSVQVEHDRHICGLFTQSEWIETLESVGFRPDVLFDAYDRAVFIGEK